MATVDIDDHYGRASVMEALQATLASLGFGDGPIPVESLAPLDQFHSRGLAATVDMAATLDPRPGSRVLDLGSGLGGPSRYLASRFGCRVTGVDLSPTFVDAATFLASRTGLGDKVDYRVANALALPFEAEVFDVVWTQHVAMNIEDRAGLYREAARVLKPGGRMANYDVLAGSGGPLHFPVPWSRGPDTSFLLTPAAMRKVVEARGFHVASWLDRTEETVRWLDDRSRREASSPGEPPAPGLEVVMGPDFGTMSANFGRNLREGRALLLEAVLERGRG